MLFVRDYLTDQTVLRSDGGHAPRVSVILPTYSRCQSAQRAIDTVLSQTFTDLELIVVDDGSTDGTCEMIEGFRTCDPRVVHVRHERNSGLPGLRTNEGIELARGEYLAFQFDDDRWRPSALQALVAEADRHPEPVVVVGKAYFNGKVTEGILPGIELNLVNLYEQNRFANNSVLFRRELVNQYGMYDCHIAMRRLCDWDLWLRYIKHLPFIAIDDIVSDVFMSKPGSLGLTVPWDLALFYHFHAIERDRLLRPNCWHDYQVDAMSIGQVELQNDFRRRVYEDHLVPYYLKYRHYFPTLEGFPATLPPRRKTVLCTKHSYDVSNDVTVGHYDALSNRRGNYKAHFQPLGHVDAGWTRDADALLLMRIVEDQAATLLDQSLAQDIPVGFYLDDDMLTFHEFGPQYNYLAPGTPFYQNLTNLLRRADAVWVTNRFILESVRPLNPRTVPHNNAVPQEALPAQIRHRDPHEPLRIGYVGSSYRLEEFKSIWQALLRVSQEYREQLCFEFWGLDVRSLPPLASPVTQRAFTFSYPLYLKELGQSKFDILLSPLLDYPHPRLGKSQIKYYETAVAGALGIFSDVPQYASLPDGLTCLKAKNTVQDWYQVLHQALALPADQFDLFRTRALAHVRQEFTEAVQIHQHEAAWRATEFHGKTRAQRYADGRPRVIYALHSPIFGGGEIQLWRRLRLAREYGIEPIIVLPKGVEGTEPAEHLRRSLADENLQLEFIQYTCFTEPRTPGQFSSDVERAEVRALIERSRPALVHTVTFIPSFGQICAELNVPHVASMYAVDESLVLLGARFNHCAINQSDSIRYAARWSQLLGTEKFCSREVVPEPIFELGLRRHLANLGTDMSTESPHRLHFVVTGTIQERKSQLETIEAIGRLSREGLDCQLDIYGYTHFFPEYMERCKERVRRWGLEERVSFKGFTEDIIGVLQNADVLLSLSTYESFPSSVKEAMAAGILVVATPVGGIPELIIDGVSGILCQDVSVKAMVDGIRRARALTPLERQRIVEQARLVARSEMHPARAANDLLTMYNRAIDVTRRADSESASQATSLPPTSVRYGSNEYSFYLSTEYLPAGTEIMYQIAWGIAKTLQRIRLFFVPSGSRREHLMILTMRALQLWKRAGWRALSRRTSEKVSQRVRHKSQPE